MFERLTERSRQAILRAQHEALAMGQNFVGTEHLLVGLVHVEGGVAARALSRGALDAAVVRTDVEGIIGAAGRLGQADADALRAIGIDLGEVSTTAEETFGPEKVQEAMFARDPRVPFTKRTKKVLELALREALSLGHGYTPFAFGHEPTT